MRNQKKWMVYLLVVLVAITFSLPCTWAAEAQKIKLSLAHIYTPKSWNETYAIPALFQLVEKQTKGKYILDVRILSCWHFAGLSGHLWWGG